MKLTRNDKGDFIPGRKAFELFSEVERLMREKEMKIEVGKSYSNRLGQKVTIVKYHDYDDFYEPDIYHFEDENGRLYTENGRYYGYEFEHQNDLIAEWEESSEDNVERNTVTGRVATEQQIDAAIGNLRDQYAMAVVGNVIEQLGVSRHPDAIANLAFEIVDALMRKRNG